MTHLTVNYIFPVGTFEYLNLGWGTMVQYFLQIMVHVFKNHVDISSIHLIIICICLTQL
jgi:hypothetical protein